MGTAYPLLFDHLKTIILLGLSIFLTIGLLNIVTTYKTRTDCNYILNIQSKHGSRSSRCKIDQFSVVMAIRATKGSQQMMIHNIMNICSILMMILVIEWMSKQIREVKILCDDQYRTTVDYSVLLDDLVRESKGTDYIDMI